MRATLQPLHAGTAQATASPFPAWKNTACFVLWQPGGPTRGHVIQGQAIHWLASG